MKNPPSVPVRPPFFFSKWDGVFLVLVLMGVAATGVFLFYGNLSTPLFTDATQSDRLVREEGTLTLVYDQPLTTYEPTVSGVVQRQYLANVYEGLVRFDRDFNLEPALALSWGMVDEITWQFKLRPNVTFHDGSTFDANDVVASLERAQTHANSGLTALVDRIQTVRVVDPLTLHMVTDEPDPTLLSKLTVVPMVPEELDDRVPTPIGTGPYAFVRQVGEEEWQFERFESYWGAAPSYPLLAIRSISDKFERYEAFVAGEVDVLAQVPPVFVDSLLTMGYPIASFPSLEVSFFLFDTQDEGSPFRYPELRQALRQTFDPTELAALTSGYAHPVSQFVSRGVFGYNSQLVAPSYDLESARALAADYVGRMDIQLDLPVGMEALGDYVEAQLEAIDLDTRVEYWPLADYQARIEQGESDFFFLAWRSELGDAGEFFQGVVHSETNHRYANTAVDAQIEAIDRNVLQSVRLEDLQSLMAYVVEEDILGIPLFESDTLVAIQKDLSAWEPRMDNLILAADFK